MKQRFSTLIGVVILLIITMQPTAQCEELKGKITNVSGNAIHISLEQKLLPQLGDKVTVFESVPGIGLIPLEGTWTISTATPDHVVATGATKSTPFVDQVVSVNSPQPQHEDPSYTKADTLYQQGLAYFEGNDDITQDLAKAFDLFSQAAHLGHAKAQFKVGYCYYFAKHVAKNPALAAQWFQKSANQGYAPAQANMGSLYSKGIGVPRDPTMAFEWFKKAADQGHPRGQNGLGHLYQTGKGVKKNHQLAFSWIRKAALQNLKDAQYNLGLYYYSGWGIEKDLSEGTKWYRKAAEQGDVKGMRKMGAAYYWGHGVAQDYRQALSWYRKAAAQKDLPSYYALGRLYKEGKGVNRNTTTAYNWYLKAAEQGHGDSQFQVASALFNGRGVAKDRRQAYQWYKKAAEQGDRYAQFSVGLYYESGLGGIPESRQDALTWYRKAADQGHEKARQKVAELTPDPIPQQAQQYLQQLQSTDGRTQQRAAKELYQSTYKNNRAVLDQVKELLLSGCTTNLRDGHHIDAMAWLCNILGTSGDPRYRQPLLDILKTRTHKKIKKYAQSNARKLGR
ncbi:SEL1-like repeat protein [Desulfuromonas acetoxidans]|uniref:Sel1 n=1 Tax=Desulfuromonas acetoxidans (strain DSM 684 / 11070) TaxID=281689 RepID=Q1JXI7_DESA6|nr:SEL1-like repeat protein [Desulfuromonas acetoxidans]EAT14975.1 Sel1 [Desulfuromonas acetoxidans DSM 684]MBF0646108.1 SEL1-like repeat protein [Desulfuromonas acetoxidans]NVD25918.1 SEL1-like repeat protein [Desulfuromonas acetoxidans]NVE17879.1 SEL1-like repeat protein [Desulfuromonas acetoxidans]